MLRTSSISEQVASHLRDELGKGRWTGLMPGRDRLVKELGVNGRTVERAMEQLEREGLLESQGKGKRRRIVAKKTTNSALQVEIVLYEADDAINNSILELRHLLAAAGHTLHFAPKTIVELRHHLQNVEKMVSQSPERVWIIQAGSRDIVEWFAQAPVPALALFGVSRDIDIAAVAVDKVAAIREAVRRLVSSGRNRIVLLSREERRKPVYGIHARSFLNELKSLGISPDPIICPTGKKPGQGFAAIWMSFLNSRPPTR